MSVILIIGQCVQQKSYNSQHEYTHHDTEDMGLFGAPIWVNTLSNHCSAPCRCISIQHGVEVTSCL